MLDLSTLDEAQQAAVVYNEGPQLVVAGAGSGKTRVLTAKIAYLLEQGVKPWRIMALTFTNKAANEMKERIAAQTGINVGGLLMGTFHSVFARILRREADKTRLRSNFTIYDESDSRSLIKTIVKQMQLDDNIYKPSAIHSRISLMKNKLVTAERYCNTPEYYRDDNQRKVPKVGLIFREYEERCVQANAMDFDDLLLNTYLLFVQHEDVRQRYEQMFDFILVDEYQDTNYAQQQILLLLRKENHHICVVGDDYQSIYGFRGANIDNILTFQRIFSDTQLFKLEQNYRSTQTIVSAANGLMKHNVHQIDKNVFSQQAVGKPIQLFEAQSDREEALIVCKQIAMLRREQGAKFGDFAVLYRTNAQSRVLEEEFQKRGYPFRIYGGTGFYQRKEIKDVIAYFRLIVNAADEEAFMRIVNFPARGIGATTLSRLSAYANQQHISLWEALDVLATNAQAVQIQSAARTRLLQFQALIHELQDQHQVLNAAELTAKLFAAVDFYAAYSVSGVDHETLARRENIEALVDSISEFVERKLEEGMQNEVSLSDYLQEVSLLTSVDAMENMADGDGQAITLMTIHMAKGLEFPVVAVVGMEENLFPNVMRASSLAELEEERRLLYVAITRAKHCCLLTYARSRWQFGQMAFNSPSRFLAELNPQYVERVGLGSITMSSRPRQQYAPKLQPIDVSRLVRIPSGPTRPSSGPAQPAPLAVGDVIEHNRFGIGKVLAVEGTGEECKATVEFRNAGTKQLLLKFAKYKKL